MLPVSQHTPLLFCHRPLRDGDVVNIDVTVFLNGYHGDTSRTFAVGAPSPNVKRMIEANEEALQESIKVGRGDAYVCVKG